MAGFGCDDAGINLPDLLRQRTVEGERIEYKAGWNPDAIVRTLCAFANDFENLGGGYVVIGQDCDAEGRPVFPPVGLPAGQIDKIQRELLSHCQLIQPPYFPVLSVEAVEGRNLIVLWAPGGQTRPYKANFDWLNRLFSNIYAMLNHFCAEICTHVNLNFNLESAKRGVTMNP